MTIDEVFEECLRRTPVDALVELELVYVGEHQDTPVLAYAEIRQHEGMPECSFEPDPATGQPYRVTALRFGEFLVSDAIDEWNPGRIWCLSGNCYWRPVELHALDLLTPDFEQLLAWVRERRDLILDHRWVLPGNR